MKDFLFRELVSEAIPRGLLSHTHQLVAKSSQLCFISNFFRLFNTLEAVFLPNKTSLDVPVAMWPEVDGC